MRRKLTPPDFPASRPRYLIVDFYSGVLPPVPFPETAGDSGGQTHQPEQRPTFGKALGQQRPSQRVGQENETPPNPQQGGYSSQAEPEIPGQWWVEESESGTDQEKQPARNSQRECQRHGRPGKKQPGRTVEVALIGQLAIPLVPLMAGRRQLYVDQLARCLQACG